MPGSAGRAPVDPVNFIQPLGDGAFYGFMHLVRVYKANFIFGRMHVDIHLIKRNFDKNNGNRKLPLDQALRKSLKDTVLDRPVAHEPAVDKDIEPPGGAARHPRRTDPAGYRKAVAVKFDGMKIRPGIFAEHIRHPVKML